MRRYLFNWISFIFFAAYIGQGMSQEATHGVPLEGEILVQNRILATVNGKSISVLDVMKKMDATLAQRDPDTAKSNKIRYEYFVQNWRQTLSQLIDNELIMADAEKLKITISDAEIRETIHERFGPNVMSTLDQLGLTFDEAWHMIYSEITVQRISGFRIYANAFNRVGPQNIKEAYEQYLVQNPPKEEWVYQVLSIRADAEDMGKIVAQKAHDLIRQNPLTFQQLADQLKEKEGKSSDLKISVSPLYTVEKNQLSASHYSILSNLNPDSYSSPIVQVGRRSNTTVHRIFYLKKHIMTPPPSFDSLFDQLQDELIYKEINKKFPPYLAKLRKQFNFDETLLNSLPPDFQPFFLR